MSSTKKIALVSGIFFVITFVTSVPVLFLYSPVLNNPDYIVGAADTRVLWGAFLEVILAIANIGAAGTLFSILKRQNEAVSWLCHRSCP